MQKVNIIGGSLLGLLCGINLLKENYEVNIYEKRNYIGGTFNSFEGMELTQPQMFHNIILSTEEKNMLENSFGIEFEKKKIYKVLNFVCGYKIDIKFGKDNLMKLFHRLAKTQNDKNIVTNLFADIDEIDRVENLLRNKSESLFFSFNKFIYEKRLNAIVNKYKKIRVENLIDSINSIYIKEVIKSTTNAKCSSIVFIEFLRIMSSSDIYSFKGGKKNLFSVLVKKIKELGGMIYLNSEVSKIELDEEKASIKIDDRYIDSDYAICTINNLYSLKEMIDEEVIDKEFQKLLKGGELFDSYLSINFYFSEDISLDTNVNRYILDKPFIDNTGSFHRKYEMYFDRNTNIMSIYMRGNYHFWEKIFTRNRIQVQINKEALTKRVLEEVLKLNLEFTKENIIKSEVITPFDFMKENNCIRGSSRGLIPTPKFYNKVIKYSEDTSRCYFSKKILRYGNYINDKFEDNIRIISKILIK
ncbi:MAG: FAD-dependent oxidoreductase [Sarcina sp.]